MNKVAMYKEEIYKQAAVIKSRMTVNKNGRKIDSRIAIHKPWYRSDKPDKYKSIVMEDIYSITPEQIKKWESSDTTREEKIKILKDVQSRLNKRTSLRAVKPLIFGRKRFDYMAKNPVHYNLYLDPSYDQDEFADAALGGFSRNRKPSEIYDYYKSKNWEGKIFSK